MSSTRAVTALAALIHDSQLRRQTAYGVALDVDAAGMLQSPESASELDRVKAENAKLRARIAEMVAVATGGGTRVSDDVGEIRILRGAVDSLKKQITALERGPALPWAAAMSDDDLHGFLDDLVSAALNRWRSEPDVPDRETLAAIEKACAEWRTPGQGLRSDDAASGPNPAACLCAQPGRTEGQMHQCEADDCVAHDYLATGGALGAAMGYVGVNFPVPDTGALNAGVSAVADGVAPTQAPREDEAETPVSPWQQAVDGLNALVDADVTFHVEPDGHVSNPFGDEHIEWDREAGRWRLVRDDEPQSVTVMDVLRAAVRNPEGGSALDEWCTGCHRDHTPDECGYRPEPGDPR